MLAIELVELRSQGVPQLPEPSLSTRVAMDFRQAGAFAAVLEPIDVHRAPRDAVRAWITIETEEEQPAANTAKAFVTGLSLLLLTPAFRYEVEARAQVEAVLRTCDGRSTSFSLEAAGSLRHPLVADEGRDLAALHAGVLERALARLVDEIGSDAALRERAAAPTCGPDAAS